MRYVSPGRPGSVESEVDTKQPYDDNTMHAQENFDLLGFLTESVSPAQCLLARLITNNETTQNDAHFDSNTRRSTLRETSAA